MRRAASATYASSRAINNESLLLVTSKQRRGAASKAKRHVKPHCDKVYIMGQNNQKMSGCMRIAKIFISHGKTFKYLKMIGILILSNFSKMYQCVITIAKCNRENCRKKNIHYLFFAAQQVVEMVVWKRNLKCCAKFAVTKPAANIMEWHHVTAAEDFSKGALEDWQQCKSNTLILHERICHN